MASKIKQEADDTAVYTETAVCQPAVEETGFTIEQLRGYCFKLFGVTESTFDAASFGLDNRRYTVDEMKKRIDTFFKTTI